MSKSYFLQNKKKEEEKKKEIPALKKSNNTVKTVSSNAGRSSVTQKNLALKQEARRTYRENVNKEREIEQKDSKVIKEYESIPEYNILERMTDENKKQAYERKNSLASEYQTAKANQISKKLSDSGIDRGTLDLVFGGVEVQNEKELPALRQQALDAEKRLQNTGMDMQQLEQYYIKNMLAPETKQAFEESAKENPVKESLFSIPVNAVGGVAGTVGSLYNYVTGKPVVDGMLMPTELGNTTRSTVTEGIDSQLGKDAYNLAMSTGDSLASIGPLQMASAGSRAFANSLYENKDRGLSADQLMLTAGASAGAEAVFEKISLDNLKGIAAGNKAVKDGAKNIFSQIIGQMAREGGEEMGTEVLNTIADTMINEDLSNYVQSVEGYMNQGMSEEDARKQTLIDTAKNVGKAGLMGAVSGGLMGTGAVAFNRVGNAFSENDSKVNAAIPSLKKETENKANTSTQEIPALKQTIETDVTQKKNQTIPSLLKTSLKTIESNVNAQKNEGKKITDVVEKNFLNDDYADTHTEAELQTMNEYINSTDPGIVEYVNQAKASGYKSKIPYRLGVAEGRVAADIERITGINTTGYELQLTNNALEHIDVDHGENGKADHTMADVNSIARMKYVIENYDNAYPGKGSGMFKTSTGHKSKTVVFEKKVDGTYYVVEAVPDTAAKCNYIVSTYASAKKIEGKQLPDVQAPSVTSKTGTALPSNSSIPSLQENVNSDYDTKTVKGFEEMTKHLDAYVGMYKGNSGADQTYTEVKRALNEYLETGSEEAFLNAITHINKLDGQLQGHSYTRKKGSKHTTTYNGEVLSAFNSYVDEICRIAESGKVQRNMGLEIEGSGGYTMSAPSTDSYISQTALNSFKNSAMFNATQETIDFLNDGIDGQQFEVNPKSELESLNEAAEMLDRDYEYTVSRLQSKTAYTGVDTDAAMMIMEQRLQEAESTGNYDDAMEWARMIVDKFHSIGQSLQALAKYSRTATGAMVKEEALRDNVTEKYAENHKSEAREAQSIADDVIEAQGLTKQEIQDIVQKSIRRSKIGKKLDDSVVEKVTNLVENGVSKDAIERAITGYLATGTTGMSQEEITQVRDLYNQSLQHGVNSKQAYNLQIQANAILAKHVGNSSFMDKWNAWRYLSMLGNTRTHIRNVGGNVMMNLVSGVKNNVAASLESLVGTASGGKLNRTKSVLIPGKDSSLIKKATADADEVYLLLTDGGSKYDMKSAIDSEKKIFKNKAVEGLRKFNSAALEAEDNLFLKVKYGTSLAGYMKANGLSENLLTRDNLTDSEKAALNKAREYAINEAKVNTFHETSKFANLISNMSNQLKQGNAGEKALHGLMEGVLPFKKTPINVLKQGLRYSPLEIIKAVTYDASKVSKGNMSGAEMIDDLAKGLTGTGIMALGAFLYRMGMLSGGPEGDEDKAWYDSMIGKQDYALQFGDGKSYTIDWLAPSSLPLFVGVEVQKMLDGEDVSLVDAVLTMSDPIVEMSMLSGLNDTLESFKYGAESGITSLGVNAVTGYLSQGVPTLLGQVARAVDDTRRTTYTGQNGIMNTIGKQINKVQNKIPGLSMKSEPYVDSWGREQENTGGSFLGRLAYNMLSPGYYAETKETKVDKELYRLYNKTEDSSVFPSSAKTNPMNAGKLTPEDYTDFSKTYGKNQYKAMQELINSDVYKNADDAGKIELINNLYNFSNALSKKKELGYMIEGVSTYKKPYQIYQDKGFKGVASLYSLRANLDGETSNAAKVQAVNDLDVPDSEKGYYLSYLLSSTSKAAQAVRDEYGDEGLYKWYSLITGAGDLNGDDKVTKKDQKIAIQNSHTLTESEKEYYLKVLSGK